MHFAPGTDKKNQVKLSDCMFNNVSYIFWGCLMSQTVAYERIQLLIHQIGQLEAFGYIVDVFSSVSD